MYWLPQCRGSINLTELLQLTAHTVELRGKESGITLGVR